MLTYEKLLELFQRANEQFLTNEKYLLEVNASERTL